MSENTRKQGRKYKNRIWEGKNKGDLENLNRNRERGERKKRKGK